MLLFRQDQLDTILRRRIFCKLEEVAERAGLALASGQNQAELKDDHGKAVNFAYQDHQLRVRSPAGRELAYHFDLVGRLIAIHTARAGLGIQYSDNAIRIGLPAEPSVLLTYDTDGTLLSLTTARATLQRVVAQRQQSWRLNGHAIVTLDFDDEHRLVTLRDALGHATKVTYQGADKTISLPNGVRRTTFRASANRSHIEQSGAPRRRLLVDQAGRLRAFQSGSVYEWLWFNREGQLEHAANGEAHVKRHFHAGLLSREVVESKHPAKRREVVATQDSDNTVSAIHCDDQLYCELKRDPDGLITDVRDWQGKGYTLDYDDDGALTQVTYPNGVRMGWASGPLGPERITIAGTIAQTELRYDYDQQGRVCARQSPLCNLTYRYDGFGRVSQMKAEGQDGVELPPAMARRYHTKRDAAGNAHLLPDGPAEYNALHQLVRHQGTRYEYDANGNVCRVVTPDATWEYSFKPGGLGDRLTEVRYQGQPVARYGYDALGRRIRKETAHEITSYQWIEGCLAEEARYCRQTGAEDLRRYLWIPGWLAPVAIAQQGRTFFLHSDRLGAPFLATDEQGVAVWQCEYDLHGNALPSIETIEQPFRLAGQMLDRETGLHYNLARYYDPRIGRYLSPDALGPKGGSLSFYSYCDGDPVNMIDPDGNAFFIPAIMALASGSAGVGAQLATFSAVGGAVGGALKAGLGMVQRAFGAEGDAMDKASAAFEPSAVLADTSAGLKEGMIMGPGMATGAPVAQAAAIVGAKAVAGQAAREGALAAAESCAMGAPAAGVAIDAALGALPGPLGEMLPGAGKMADDVAGMASGATRNVSGVDITDLDPAKFAHLYKNPDDLLGVYKASHGDQSFTIMDELVHDGWGNTTSQLRVMEETELFTGVLDYKKYTDEAGNLVEAHLGVVYGVPGRQGAGHALGATFMDKFADAPRITSSLIEKNEEQLLGVLGRTANPTIDDLASSVPAFRHPGYDYKLDFGSGGVGLTRLKQGTPGPARLANPEVFQSSAYQSYRSQNRLE